MKVLKYGIALALVSCAIVLALDVIGLVLLLFLLDIPAAVLNWREAQHVSGEIARWCTVIGSVTFLPGVIGWIIFFANKDRVSASKNRKDVK